VWFPSTNEYRPLRDVSPIVNAMAQTQFDDCVKKVRIFVSPDVRESIPTGVSVDDVVREVLQAR
jgi:hypothetical protein